MKINDQLVMFEGQTIDREERNVIAKTGETRYYHTEKKPIKGADGIIVGMFGISTDITDTKSAESKVEALLAEQAVILNNQLVGMVTLRDRKILWANSAFETLLGYDEGELIGAPTRQCYVSDEDYQTIGIAYKDIEDGGVVRNEIEFVRKDGQFIWVALRGAALHNNPADSIWVFVDISDRKYAEEKLKLSGRVFNDTHEGIIITDANKLIIDVNPAFCTITGYNTEEVLGQNPSILSSGKQSPEFYRDMWHNIDKHGYWQGEVWNRKKGGELYAELLIISALKDGNDKVVNYVGLFSDITSSKQHQDELSIMAHYDVLTGLPNRTLFIDRFNQAIAHSKRSQSLLAVCFLDLDNFKPVNDNYGHAVGDQLLIEVAQRIKGNIREADTVSRQGGDEFAILLGDINSYTQCQRTLDRILNSLAQPYLIDGYPHKITASIGVTLYPEDNEDLDTLLRHADNAMYQAKLKGKHRFHLFNTQHAQMLVLKNHQLDEVSDALDNNELQLYYQPKVNMVTGDVFGAEALIRWNHPKKGLIPPLDFLPLIDGTYLEIQVGDWVINQALIQLTKWKQQGINLEVSVNIASHHLLSDNFFAHLDKALAKNPTTDSQYLQLEILESSALGDLNTISLIIENCQEELGVKIALDDFGTGYSSLTHLRSLPANTIKVDQSFVRDMLDDPSDFNIIEAVIGLADTFGREVIAEGVETTVHGLMLILIGCEEAQGYGIAKPMPADDIPKWLSNYTPNQAWLACANKELTPQESKVKQFELASEQWKHSFVTNINSSHEDIKHWPILNQKRCHCGTWIKRVRQELLFEEKDLKQLSETHEALHRIANELHQQYQDNSVNTARESLVEFQAAFDDMHYVLEAM
ncbi:MAG: EAL domain-containing protein [Methylococcaceae bacterium]|nr:EAL domain-containing protein [Methylococcaceae bacterium]